MFMEIVGVKVKNFRNLDGLKVSLDPCKNYIIGENNIGKSNFLNLLSKVCNASRFADDDFQDPSLPIEVLVQIRLKEDEYGFFGDNFSPANASVVNLVVTQELSDAYPSLYSYDSYEALNKSLLDPLNFFLYETTANPKDELSLRRNSGTGLFVEALIEKYYEDRSLNILNQKEVNDLSRYINSALGNIKGFQEYSIQTTVAEDSTEMLRRLLLLSDGDREMYMTGSGVQYLAMASISILGQIMRLFKRKRIPFQELLYTDSKTNEILLPMIIAIDEPEVHLHPFLQRSLISYYDRIAQNQDAEFKQLLKDTFGIDGIKGQLIVVTHSTDSLVGDYRNIIRFYQSNNLTHAICGTELVPKPGQDSDNTISEKNEKHLIMNFPELKESFYAKCAIIVEGETEFGCLPYFAKTINCPLDDKGISLINARGSQSIAPIKQLLELYRIPCITVYDGDVKEQKEIDLSRKSGNEFYTQMPCFEFEIVDELLSHNEYDLLDDIIAFFDPNATSTIMDKDFIKKSFKKMEIPLDEYKDICLADIRSGDANLSNNEKIALYSAWLLAKKGVVLGRVIGRCLKEEQIPETYKKAIHKAVEVSENGD